MQHLRQKNAQQKSLNRILGVREYPFRLIKELEKDNEREDISKIKTIRLRKKSD